MISLLVSPKGYVIVLLSSLFPVFSGDYRCSQEDGSVVTWSDDPEDPGVLEVGQ